MSQLDGIWLALKWYIAVGMNKKKNFLKSTMLSALVISSKAVKNSTLQHGHAASSIEWHGGTGINYTSQSQLVDMQKYLSSHNYTQYFNSTEDITDHNIYATTREAISNNLKNKASTINDDKVFSTRFIRGYQLLKNGKATIFLLDELDGVKIELVKNKRGSIYLQLDLTKIGETGLGLSPLDRLCHFLVGKAIAPLTVASILEIINLGIGLTFKIKMPKGIIHIEITILVVTGIWNWAEHKLSRFKGGVADYVCHKILHLGASQNNKNYTHDTHRFINSSSNFFNTTHESLNKTRVNTTLSPAAAIIP